MHIVENVMQGKICHCLMIYLDFLLKPVQVEYMP